VIPPVFVFDSRERWFPVGVEESLLPHGYEWTGDGWKVRGAIFAAERLNFPADMRQPDLPPVGYHRVQKGGDLHWHQYWLWYLYNPWEVAGIGRHEGDWEFVQLGCTDKAGDEPVLLTCSQHHSGGKREAWACEAFADRPVIYVAVGSHANYFTAGQHGGIDRCNGKGRTFGDCTDDGMRAIEWRPFGAWASWPGRWGNSDNSPQSPGRQGHRWSAPHLYHSSAVSQ